MFLFYNVYSCRYTLSMEILYSVLLFLILLGILYCIRSLRALHGKVSKKTEQISREINKAALENKKMSMTAYRQTEAFIQLSNLLQFKSPIPATRSWAASPDLLLLISETVKKNRPSLVVELGSGVSTLVCAKSGRFQSLVGFKINWNRPVVKAIRYGIFKVRMRRTRNKPIIQQVTQFFKTPQNLTG